MSNEPTFLQRVAARKAAEAAAAEQPAEPWTDDFIANMQPITSDKPVVAGDVEEEGADPASRELFDRLAERRATSRATSAAPQQASSTADDRDQRYAQATVERLAGEVAMAIQGTRNGTLNERALRAYRVADACGVDREFVTARMTDAARRCGLDDSEIAKTLASARDGADKYGPADIPERETYGDAYTIEPPPTESGGEDESDPPLYSDIGALLDGTLPEPPKPEILRRTDGNKLFYRGEQNLLYGDPEDGKTWIALAAIAEELRNGGTALFIDLDDNGAAAVINRLLMLGAPRNALADPDRFRHCEPADALTLKKIIEDSARWQPDVVALDCVGELLPMVGAKSDSADDYTTAMRWLRPFVKAGAAVILIDHMAKNPDSRAYGSGGTMAKKRKLGGSMIRVKRGRQFAPGQGGSAHLFVAKDRHGGVRQHCPPAPAGGREQDAGTFVLDPPDTNGASAWRIILPFAMIGTVVSLDDQALQHLQAARELGRAFGVDELAGQVSGEPALTTSQRETARRNIDKLATDGWLTVLEEPRRGRGGAGSWEVAENHAENHTGA